LRTLPRLICLLLWLVLPSLAGAPRRIVSTAPSITEILFALGLGSRVVAVTSYCHYPPGGERLPRIGSYTAPNLEKIVELQPDLVIIQENPIGLRSKLERLGLRVLELPHMSVDDILESIRLVAQQAGVPERGQILASRLQQSLSKLEQTTRPLPRRRVLFVVGRTPGQLQQLIVAGGSSYLNALIRVAGGRNVFEDTPVAYPRVSLEAVLARDPEVIIDASTIGSPQGHNARRLIEDWQQLRSLAATRAGRIHAVFSDLFVVPGPRMVLAARALAQLLHGDSQ